MLCVCAHLFPHLYTAAHLCPVGNESITVEALIFEAVSAAFGASC